MRNHSLLLLSLLLGLAGCPSAGEENPGDDDDAVGDDDDAVGDDDDSVDTTAPYVVSTSPEDGAAGVWSDTAIEIWFSEAMNIPSVEGALDTSSLGDVGMSWNDGDDVLTIAPIAFLQYAAGDGNDPTSVEPREYRVVLGTGATDREGNAIEAGHEVVFTTLKRMDATYERDNDVTGTATRSGPVGDGNDYLRVGDDDEDAALRAFVTFDLSEMPASAVGVESAWLYTTLVSDQIGDPWSLGLEVLVEHGVYPRVDGEAWAADPLTESGGLQDSGGGSLYLSVSDEVEDDILNRAAREDRSQFRFRMAVEDNENGVADQVYLSRDALELEVTYLAP